MTPPDLRREGVRIFADLALVGVALVLLAQFLGPGRGVATGLLQLLAMLVAAAILSGPLLALKLRTVSRGRSSASGPMRATRNLIQVWGYAVLWGAIALAGTAVASSGLTD